MFDIFEDKVEQEFPKLYIADIIVCVHLPSRSKNIRYEERKVRLDNWPIVLLNGSMPTKKSENAFFRSVHNNFIHRGEFNKIKFKIESISNARFSSNLMYKFDFNIH